MYQTVPMDYNPVRHYRFCLTPSNLVVAHWPSEVESTAPLDFLLRHGLWTPFECPMSCKIRSIISATCGFTTKSDGIWDFPFFGSTSLHDSMSRGLPEGS